MSDMRNFTPSNDTQSVFVDSGVIETHEAIKETYVLEDSGGLGGFHQAEVEEEGAGRNKAIGALALALMLGAVGAYAYTTWRPANDVVADEIQPVAPKTAAVAPPPAAPAAQAAAPADTAMAAPVAPDVVKPAARTTQERVANAPRVTPLPQSEPLAAAPSPAIIAAPQSQASAVPEPVSPTPPASAVAGNPPLNEQSAPIDAAPVTPTVPEATPAAQPEPAPAPVDQSQ